MRIVNGSGSQLTSFRTFGKFGSTPTSLLPVRGWTMTGAEGASIAAAFGTDEPMALVNGPAFEDTGPNGARLLNLVRTSSQYGSFTALDVATEPSDMEIWALCVLTDLTSTFALFGRASSNVGYVMFRPGGELLLVRTNGGAATDVAIGQALGTEPHVLRIRYDAAAGEMSVGVDGEAQGDPVAVGGQGFIFDSLGQANGGNFAALKVREPMIFDRLLSDGEATQLWGWFGYGQAPQTPAPETTTTLNDGTMLYDSMLLEDA